MMDYQIVPMTSAHIGQIAALEKSCFSDPWPPEAFESELTNPLSLWLVAAAGEDVLGYIGSQSGCGSADLMNLAVVPACRRLGVGTVLLTELCRRLTDRRVETVLLEVRKSNASAIALYEGLGFTLAGVRRNYYFHPREDALILIKRLETV